VIRALKEGVTVDQFDEAGEKAVAKLRAQPGVLVISTNPFEEICQQNCK